MSYAAQNAVMDAVVVLGDFTLKHKIGEGGFGTVYLAEQQALGRLAVVKVMRRSLASRRDAVERFMLEARLASQLDHPCAAHVYACGAEPDGTLWIAMELVKGTTLDSLLESGPLSLDRVVPMIERLCEAVHAAHDQGIVHRDIKPANVMVTAKAGRLMPKLLDFGIAKQFVASQFAIAGERAKPASIPVSPATLGDEHTVQSPTDAPSSTAPTGSLTQAGQLLGSPPYMAPEQWVDASLVGPWTDQYALALLAYEALTGERAYTGRSIASLADQHQNAPLPRSSRIPDPVYDVLTRAAAKDPRDRFPDLEQLVTALRASTGWAVDADEPLPTLRPELHATWTTDAPQPIAEAIAALVTARSPVRMSERATAVGRVLARWLGVLAIASRSRIGRLDTQGAGLLDALRELRRQPPRDEQWIDLVAAFAREFADRPEAFPIPELVMWCADPHGLAALRELVRVDPTIGDGDVLARRRAAAQIASVETTLSQLGWLLDYEIGREVAGGIELWMGPRSDERIVRHGPSDGDRVVVLDADGARVVSLSPLVQIAAPIPGEPEELFVFSGPSRSGEDALCCALPRGYEREDAEIWPWLASHLLDTGAGLGSSTDDDDRPPYPGLAAFTGDDHGSFVGREREVAELVNRLRTQAIVAVVGPSGAGKSSFVAAGVIPALPPGWQGITIRPGRDPVAALASIAERVDSSPYRGAHESAAVSPADLAARLMASAEHRAMTLVVFVDQAEELFTQGATDDQRAAFAEMLVALSASPRLRIVLGMRDDFLCRIDELPAWRGMIGRAVQILGVPSRGDLERIIAEPARRRGYELDDPSLPATMVAEVAERPGALSLLSFAAAELWARRDRHFRRITKATYDQIGGVTGALVQHADGVVDRMPAGDRRLVKLAFRRLLTAEGARIVHGRAELVAAIGGGNAGAAIVERLLAARLIVSRDDDAGERVEIIHEALTTTWPRLAAWRHEDARGAKLHEQLAAAARHWHDRGRPNGLLWRDDALVELRRWRATGDAATTPIEEAFGQASEAAARGLRRRRFAIVGIAFAVLASVIVVLALFNHRISAQRVDAVRRVAASFEERGRLALASGEAAPALLYLAEASRLGVSGPAHDLLVARAAAPVEAFDSFVVRGRFMRALLDDKEIATWDGEVGQLWDRATGLARISIPDTLVMWPVGDAIATLSNQGDVMVTEATGVVRWRVERGQPDPNSNMANLEASVPGDVVMSLGGPIVRLWGLRDGRVRGALEHPSAVENATLDAGGRRLATVDGVGVVRIWDIATATLAASCTTPKASLFSVRFTPSGDTVIVGGKDGIIRVCDATTGALRHLLSGHRNVAHRLDVSSDGALLVSASSDATARLWNLATGEPRGVLVGHRGAIGALKLSPDGRRVATGGEDATVRIWDVESSAQLATLQGHQGGITSLRWEAEDRLITASFDGTIRRWRVDRAQRDAVAPGHDDRVEDLHISSDGTRSLTIGDGIAIVWDVATGARHATLRGVHRLTSAAFVGTTHVITAADDGRVQLWPVAGGLPTTLSIGDSALVAAAADGNTIATASRGGAVRLWRVDGVAIGTVAIGAADVGGPPKRLVFDPTGRWLAVLPDMDTPAAAVKVIDTTTGREAASLSTGTRVFDVVMDRTRLAIAYDQHVRVFELGTWSQIATHAGHRGWVEAVALLPDGRVATAGDDAKVLVWDRAGRVVASLLGNGAPYGINASADGRLLAVGTSEGAIDVWDVTTSARLITLRGHRRPTSNVRFAGDATHAVSAGLDGRVASWDLRHPTRSYAELAKLVMCRVPLRLEGDIALPRDIDFDAPACQ